MLDGVTDAATGDVVTAARARRAARPASTPLRRREPHRLRVPPVQLRVIEELAAPRAQGPDRPRDVPGRRAGDARPLVDRAGAFAEADFLAQSRWYNNWGYHWEYYRPIFDFAQRERPADVRPERAAQGRADGAQAGARGAHPGAARAAAGERIDTDSAEQRRPVRAFFSGRRTARRDVRRDVRGDVHAPSAPGTRAMAHNAIKALRSREKASAPIMVVLIGEGTSPTASAPSARRSSPSRAASPRSSRCGSRIRRPKTRSTEARASYADFLWGVPAATDPLYPVLGLSAPEREPGQPMTVIQVEKESVAAAAGFAVGDVLVAMDGTPIDQKETFNRLMSEKRWGDSARFEVLPRRARRRRSPPTSGARPRRRPRPARPAPAAAARAQPARGGRRRRRPPVSLAARRRAAGGARRCSSRGSLAATRRCAPRRPPAAPRPPPAHRRGSTRARARSGGRRPDRCCRAAATVEFLLNARLEITRSEPAGEPVPLGDVAPFSRHQRRARRPRRERRPASRYRVRLPAGGGTLHSPTPGKLRLRPRHPGGGVPARLPRDRGHRLAGGRLPRRQRLLVSAVRSRGRAGRVRAHRRARPRAGTW